MFSRKSRGISFFVLVTDFWPSGLNVLAFVLVFFFVYETKEATLEELNSICKLKVLYHASFKLSEPFMA